MSDAVFADVTDAPIDVAPLLARVAASGHGAATLFVGVVRDLHEGKAVVAVTYDCHVPLARAALRAIADETAVRWPVKVAVVHRTGRLAVGEASVAIAVGSPHRAAAYEASRHVIEEIKVRVPVWKEEHYAVGSSAWLDGHSIRPEGAGAVSADAPDAAPGSGRPGTP
jgi:molybdopterin synthase catalytic subunit